MLQFFDPESIPCRRLNRQQLFQQRLQQLQIQRIGPVGLCVRRVVVNFEKEAIDAGSDGGAMLQTVHDDF